MTSRLRATLLLVITMLIWGSTFAVTKEIVDRLPPFTLAFMRVAIAFLTLAPLAWGRLRGSRKAAAANQGSADLGADGASAGGTGGRWPWGTIAAMAFIGVALYYGLFNAALLYVSSTQGALVQSCIPAATALVAVLWLGERADAWRWCGLALSGLGVLIVLLGSAAMQAVDGPAGQGRGSGMTAWAAAALGNLLMFATVLCWGFYTALAKRVAQVDTAVVTAGLFAVGALMLLPLALAETAAYGLPRLDLSRWMGVLYLGAIATGLAFMLYNTALADMDASHVGVYTNLIPFVGVITGVVVLKEPLSLSAAIGGVLVLLGIALASRRTGARGPAAMPNISQPLRKR